jgi:AmmeMemoRadiSam system protein B/AmmeMemoRadiSam system protein A
MRQLQIVLILIFCLGCRSAFQAKQEQGSGIRPPAVAGQFYPGDAHVLNMAVQSFLKDALPPKPERPIALIVPHAGYIYSGQIAADAYRQAANHTYDVVVVLGTNHTVPGLMKIWFPPESAFQTPLGNVTVDKAGIDALIKADPDCIVNGSAHAKEHSIEVQLPFIQSLFPKAQIVPAIVGYPDLGLCLRFGKALATVFKDRQVLIVASSDLSHYPNAADARKADRRTLESAVKLDPALFQKTVENRTVANLDTAACGEAPIMATLAAAKGLGATRGVVVSAANSGDVGIGEFSRVVGYGAVVLTAGSNPSDVSALESAATPPSSSVPLNPADHKALLAFARETIVRYLTTQTVPLPRGFNPRLQRERGVFVTLNKRGELRGCIGNMTPNGPLCRLVSAMALESAFRDSRFTPVTLDEVPQLEIEISVLTPMQPIRHYSEIVVGRDGVLLSKNGRSAVFLPQVAPEQGWSREQMLDNLCLKAGLPAGSWKDGASFSVFQAEVFHE